MNTLLGLLMTFSTYEANGHFGPEVGRDRAARDLRDGLRRDQRVRDRALNAAAQFQDPKPRRKPLMETARQGREDLDAAHARNFLDCVKSRKRPNADVEDGHRSTTFALLANIALATKARLDWDPQAERFTNNDAANALLDYEYRKPWTHG